MINRSVGLALGLLLSFFSYGQSIEFKTKIDYLYDTSDTLLREVQHLGDTVIVTSANAITLLTNGKVISSTPNYLITGGSDLDLRKTPMGIFGFTDADLLIYGSGSWDTLITFRDETGQDLEDVTFYNDELYLLTRNELYTFHVKDKMLQQVLTSNQMMRRLVVNDEGAWIEKSGNEVFVYETVGYTSTDTFWVSGGITAMLADSRKVYVGLWAGQVFEASTKEQRWMNREVLGYTVSDFQLMGDSLLFSSSWSRYIEAFGIKDTNRHKALSLNIGTDIIKGFAITDSLLYVATGQNGLYIYDLTFEKTPTQIQKPLSTLNEYIEVYPNPAYSEVLIDLARKENQQQEQSWIKVSVIDLAGREIKKQGFNGINDQLSLDISSLKRGSYFIRVEWATGGGVSQIMKL